METFIRVYEAGSFSGAARQLRTGQPAVSKAVAHLERHLGVRLLTRTTRGLSPTEAGERYYQRARRAIEEAAEAEADAKGAAALSGRLRVSTAVSFGRLHIVPYLGPFLAAHPALTLELLMNDSRTDLIEAGADVALRFGPGADSTLTGRPIARSPRTVVGTAAFFDAFGTPHRPSDLAGLPSILVDQPGFDRTWTFTRGEESEGVRLNGRLQLDAAEGVRAAVLAGLGFTIASSWMFAPEIATGAARAVLGDWELPSVELWALFPAGRLISAKARAFVGFVEDRLAIAL